jgi:hypothetical protein
MLAKEDSTLDETLLHDRDYTLIIAKTATDHLLRPPGFAKRWIAVEAAVLTLMKICERFDPDGITLYVSCYTPQGAALFKQYKHLTSGYLEPVLQGNFPPDQVDLQQVLQSALDDYFVRKAAGLAKKNGEMILVMLDGEPRDRLAMMRTIKEATDKIDGDEELGIGFVQVGEDAIARGFLTAMDHYLQEMGARFDIVNYRQLETIEMNSLAEFLLNVLND